MRREIALCIVLTIITCGIYGIYWIIMINNEINVAVNDQAAPSGGLVVVLSLITCGIYGLYWLYKMGEKCDYIKSSRNIPSSSSNVLFLILGIFGLTIVAYALIQDTINKYVAVQ